MKTKELQYKYEARLKKRQKARHKTTFGLWTIVEHQEQADKDLAVFKNEPIINK